MGRRRSAEPARAARPLAGSALFLVCAVVAFLPQMLAWQAIYGSLIARSPVGPQIRWPDPHLVDILWSARNGLFSTSPILYLGAIGLVAFAIARPAVGLPVLRRRVVMIYFNALHPGLVGQRRIRRAAVRRHRSRCSVWASAFVESAAGIVRRHALAAVLAVAADRRLEPGADGRRAERHGPYRRDAAVRSRLGAQARVVHGWFGNPFTYPASLVFALRNGVSPGDYDLLSTNRFLADPLRPYGRSTSATRTTG